MRVRVTEVGSGPYGFLVTDAVIRPNIYSSNDYLRAPEIAEEIGTRARRRLDMDLFGLYQRHTAPAVVKFYNAEYTPNCLESALCYLYFLATGWEPVLGGSVAYNAKGRTIPPEQILSVELVTGHS
jgi:hypothetical protein